MNPSIHWAPNIARAIPDFRYYPSRPRILVPLHVPSIPSPQELRRRLPLQSKKKKGNKKKELNFEIFDERTYSTSGRKLRREIHRAFHGEFFLDDEGMLGRLHVCEQVRGAQEAYFAGPVGGIFRNRGEVGSFNEWVTKSRARGYGELREMNEGEAELEFVREMVGSELGAREESDLRWEMGEREREARRVVEGERERERREEEERAELRAKEEEERAERVAREEMGRLRSEQVFWIVFERWMRMKRLEDLEAKEEEAVEEQEQREDEEKVVQEGEEQEDEEKVAWLAYMQWADGEQ